MKGHDSTATPDPEAIKAMNAKVADEFRANDGKVGGADISPIPIFELARVEP